MGTTAKKIKGRLEQVRGTVQKTLGQALNDKQMEAEGTAHELAGEAKVEAARGVERAKGKLEEVAGKVMSKVGELVGDDETKTEGTLHELKGVARQEANRKG